MSPARLRRSGLPRPGARFVTTADVSKVLADPANGPGLLETARFAGILAAKKTSSLVPLCHPIRLDGVAVDVRQAPDGFRVIAEATIVERTGVEMEALTACASCRAGAAPAPPRGRSLHLHRRAHPVAQDRWPLGHVATR